MHVATVPSTSSRCNNGQLTTKRSTFAKGRLWRAPRQEIACSCLHTVCKPRNPSGVRQSNLSLGSNGVPDAKVRHRRYTSGREARHGKLGGRNEDRNEGKSKKNAEKKCLRTQNEFCLSRRPDKIFKTRDETIGPSKATMVFSKLIFFLKNFPKLQAVITLMDSILVTSIGLRLKVCSSPILHFFNNFSPMAAKHFEKAFCQNLCVFNLVPGSRWISHVRQPINERAAAAAGDRVHGSGTVKHLSPQPRALHISTNVGAHSGAGVNIRLNHSLGGRHQLRFAPCYPELHGRRDQLSKNGGRKACTNNRYKKKAGMVLRTKYNADLTC